MGADWAMKKHLVVYNYGQGGLWAFIHANSAQEIEDLYPELKVVDQMPSWMTPEMASRLEECDLEDRPGGFLAGLLQERERQRRIDLLRKR
jgi:hypothetical protein